MAEKPVSPGITSSAQGPALGSSALPSDPRFLPISLRRLLPPRLLALTLAEPGAGHERLDPGARAGFEEALNALVLEASDHPEIEVQGATRRKCSRNPLGEFESPTSSKAGALKTERVG